MTDFHSGNRLNRVRKARRYRLKELADVFRVKAETIQQWQQRGIPSKAIRNVADFFGLEEGVFLDPAITAEDFEKIIANLKPQDVYQPSVDRKLFGSRTLVMIENDIGRQGIHRSGFFKVYTPSVLIRARVGGSKKQAICQFSLCKKKEERFGKWPSEYISRARGMELTLYVWTRPDTSDNDEIVQEKIVNMLEEGDYYLNVHCENRYEVSVFGLIF